MKISRYLFVWLAAATAGVSHAQIGEKVSFGIRAGVASSRFACSDEPKLLGLTDKQASNFDVSSKSATTFNVGLIMDIPVVKKWNFSVQTGVWFTERKATIEGVNSYYTDGSNYGHSGGYTTTITVTSESNAMFVSVPVLLTYHYNFGSVRAEMNFGPYVEYGIGDGNGSYTKSNVQKGYYNGKDIDKSNIDSNEGKFYGEDASHLGYGLSFGAGAYWKKMYLGLKYDLGLNDYAKESDVDYTVKSRMTTLCLGYNF